LFDYACQFAFQSTDEELVKLGIGLLGLFDLSNDDKIIDKLLVLALYEEFTLYVIVAVLKYPNGNDIVFRIAQKVDGGAKSMQWSVWNLPLMKSGNGFCAKDVQMKLWMLILDWNVAIKVI